jgi:hypothetical protein
MGRAGFSNQTAGLTTDQMAAIASEDLAALGSSAIRSA